MAHQVNIEAFCSKCRRDRPTNDFELNKSGKRNKTCKRHSQKRPLEVELDDWAGFIVQIQTWNESVRRLYGKEFSLANPRP